MKNVFLGRGKLMREKLKRGGSRKLEFHGLRTNVYISIQNDQVFDYTFQSFFRISTRGLYLFQNKNVAYIFVFSCVFFLEKGIYYTVYSTSVHLNKWNRQTRQVSPLVSTKIVTRWHCYLTNFSISQMRVVQRAG